MITKQEYLETLHRASNMLVFTDIATKEEKDQYTIIIGKIGYAIMIMFCLETPLHTENLPDNFEINGDVEQAFRALQAFVRKNTQ